MKPIHSTTFRSVRLRLLVVLVSTLVVNSTSSQIPSTENVILITLDGLRWQELFSGADPELIGNEEYVEDAEQLADRFWSESPYERRRRLMPFMWDSVATKGALFGNRALGSRVNVSNGHNFSYPGYNEILTGFADERIDSNDKIPNRNVTVLEWLNLQQGLEGGVAVYASWDVFPFIVNETRSGVPVNAGFESVHGAISQTEGVLNRVQVLVDTPWDWERYDAFTHYLGMAYLERVRPRLLYVAYGDTDEYAHSGNYASYLTAANRTDGFIAELWNWVQSTEGYRDRTTLVITTDHGRGDADRWIGHGSDWEGSDAIWIAVMGPDTNPLGEVTQRSQLYQNQIASTVAALLGYNYTNARPVGPPIQSVLK